MFYPEIITQIINMVGTKEKNDQIFFQSKKYYDLHQFNVGSLYPKDVKKMNQSLKRRYKHQEIQILPNNWNQGQRRLFVWFIICFMYERKIKISDITEEDLKSLSQIFYQKQTTFLDFQLRNLPRVTKAKRAWSPEEDELLKNAIKTLKGEAEDLRIFNNWNEVAKIIFFQTQRRIFRTPKSCRQRWYNHLDQSKKKDDFSLQQDLTLINYILSQSKSWSKIVKLMDYSRTEHRVKNRYYTLIRKYQKSVGGLQTEELNEQEEKQVVLKLKFLLEAKRDKEIGPNQINEKRGKEGFMGVKIEEEHHKFGQNVEDRDRKQIQHFNSSQNIKIKTQTDHLSCESVPKVQMIHQEELSIKSMSSWDQLNQSQNSQVQEFKTVPITAGYWSQARVSHPYYDYYINIIPHQVINSSEVFMGPIIVNQLYCPIYYQNGIGQQFYHQQ